MDIDTHRLVIELCTRVGMIFEDASPHALEVSALSRDDLVSRVVELAQATSCATALLAGANALMSTALRAND
jgi:hypothetical protein